VLANSGGEEGHVATIQADEVTVAR
jgi:hypothetical protein